MKEKPGMTPAALKALAAGDLHNAALAMAPGGIEAQEKAGQTVFAQAETLPTEGIGDRQVLAAHGFVIGAAADELFTHASLPPGWKKVPTEHSMWTDLVDDQGRLRANMFFKAAFYDRKAHMSWRSCVTVTVRAADGRGRYDVPEGVPVPMVGVVEKAGKEVFRTSPVPVTRPTREAWDLDEMLDREAQKWADENYPGRADPFAYWE